MVESVLEKTVYEVAGRIHHYRKEVHHKKENFLESVGAKKR